MPNNIYSDLKNKLYFILYVQSMLEKIKEAVFAKYKKEDIYWIFLSVFDENNKMLMSNGVFYTDKVLDNILDTLYHWLVEKYKDISSIIVDLIIDTQEITDTTKINDISMVEYWLAVITGDKYWVLLPNTAWISNWIQALQLIKQKDQLEWNAQIIKFHTDRILIK